MDRTGEAGGPGVRIQFGEIWRIDDRRIKNEVITVGQRPASDIQQSSHQEGYFVFSMDLIVYRNDKTTVKKRITAVGQRLGCQ